MMPTRNVNLTDRFDQFVEKQVEAGRFLNASEVVRAGLHLLEQQTRTEKETLKLLRSLANEGFEQLDQGRGVELRDERQLVDFIERIDRRVANKVSRRSRNT